MLKDARPSSCLSRSVNAVAQQYIYNLRGQRRMKLRAQDYYSQSLDSIHRALEDPHERLTDATLLSVWLVGLYEVSDTCVSFINQLPRLTFQLLNGVIKGVMDDSKAWTSHVNGTALLLRLRGSQQFETLSGRAVFRLAYGLTVSVEVYHQLKSSKAKSIIVNICSDDW